MNKRKNNFEKTILIENNWKSLIKNQKLKLLCTQNNCLQYTADQIEINEYKIRWIMNNKSYFMCYLVVNFNFQMIFLNYELNKNSTFLCK